MIMTVFFAVDVLSHCFGEMCQQPWLIVTTLVLRLVRRDTHSSPTPLGRKLIPLPSPSTSHFCGSTLPRAVFTAVTSRPPATASPTASAGLPASGGSPPPPGSPALPPRGLPNTGLVASLPAARAAPCFLGWRRCSAPPASLLPVAPLPSLTHVLPFPEHTQPTAQATPSPGKLVPTRALFKHHNFCSDPLQVPTPWSPPFPG